MKEILAIIRMNKINQTKIALAEAGLPAFTAAGVLGRGKGKVDFKLLKGAEAGIDEAIALLSNSGPRLIPKRAIYITLPDDKVSVAIKAIIKINQTGNAGDGKIFVSPIEDVIRVRTGESGEVAVDESR